MPSPRKPIRLHRPCEGPKRRHQLMPSNRRARGRQARMRLQRALESGHMSQRSGPWRPPSQAPCRRAHRGGENAGRDRRRARGVGSDVVQLAPPVRRHGHRRSERTQGTAGAERQTQTTTRRRRTGEGRPAGGGEGKILSPADKRRAVDMLVTTMRVSKRLACRAVGLARSTYSRTPIAQTPADPDAALRAILRDYARTHPLHGFRRAWAHLRHDQAIAVNKKKVHRLWKEEGLQEIGRAHV